MVDQLSLPLSVRNEATFANFLAEPGSLRAQVVALLENAAVADSQDTAIYL